MARRVVVATHRVCWSRLPRRALSSHASSSDRDELQTGWHARLGWLERTLQRAPRLVDYAERRVFAPSLSAAHHALMFVALNAPQRLDLDVVQFLEGAAVATTRVLEDASDEGFVQLVRDSLDRAPSTDGMATSPIVRRMHDYCLPACLEQLHASVQRQLTLGIRTHTIDVHVERVHLTRVQYACTSAREDDAQVLRDNPESLDVDPSHEVDGPLAVERLQLQVEVRTLEWLRRTRRTRYSTAVTELQQRNVYVARFISLVTDPDQLDWRLASIAVRTRGKPVEVSSTCVTHRPAIQ